jgi:hypothetical protein
MSGRERFRLRANKEQTTTGGGRRRWLGRHGVCECVSLVTSVSVQSAKARLRKEVDEWQGRGRMALKCKKLRSNLAVVGYPGARWRGFGERMLPFRRKDQ